MGADADVVVLHPGSLEVQYVIANGKLLKSPETCEAVSLSDAAFFTDVPSK